MTLENGALTPAYESEFAAGCDVRANFTDDKKIKGEDIRIIHELDENSKATTNIIIRPQGRALIPTGIKVAVPEGYEMQVRPRSGLAIKQGITVLNTPGTVDSDYRGEVGVILVNTSKKPVKITNNERVAQLVLSPVIQGTFKVIKKLPETKRGEGGFGSTGKK